jgi:hypothetical protein
MPYVWTFGLVYLIFKFDSVLIVALWCLFCIYFHYTCVHILSILKLFNSDGMIFHMELLLESKNDTVGATGTVGYWSKRPQC